MQHDKQLLAGVLGAISTILGEIITRLLVYFKVGQIDLYQFHSLFLTIEEPSLVLGLIVSLIIGTFVAAFLYGYHEKHGPDGIVIRCTMVYLFVWLALEVIFTIFFAGLLNISRPIKDHYIYLAGMIISGITLGCLLNYFVFKKGRNRI